AVDALNTAQYPSPTTFNAVFDAAGNFLGSGVNAPINIPGNGSILLTTLFSDPWFNGLTRDGTSDGCEGKTTGPVTASANSGNTGIRMVYSPYEVQQIRITDARGPDA